MSEAPRVRLQRSVVGLGTLAAVGAVLFIGASAYFSMTRYIAPDEFAIRQVNFGPGKGVQNTIIGPGLQVVIPGYERLHVFPRDLQVLDLNTNDESVSHGDIDEDYTRVDAIRIQTSDGFQVTVDVTVMYRVTDPYLVLTRVGPGKLYEDSVVRKFADQFLRKSFGPLAAEDFYVDWKRMEAEKVARDDLTKELATWGLTVWGVVVRDYAYDERFQHQIEARKIADQRTYKNQAETLREQRLQEKNTKVANMQRQVEQLRGEGDLAVRRLKADADLYHREQVAMGSRAVALAQADSARMERDALESAGASNIVGLEMAEALRGTQVIVISTTGPGATNPLELDKLVGGW